MPYRAPYPRLYCELNIDAHFGNVLRGKLLRIMRHSHENLSICGECMESWCAGADDACLWYLCILSRNLSYQFWVTILGYQFSEYSAHCSNSPILIQKVQFLNLLGFSTVCPNKFGTLSNFSLFFPLCYSLKRGWDFKHHQRFPSNSGDVGYTQLT